MVSTACKIPTRPGTGPKTPASEHDGQDDDDDDDVGGCGYRQR